MTPAEIAAAIRAIIQEEPREYKPLGARLYFCYTVPQIQEINRLLALLESS